MGLGELLSGVEDASLSWGSDEESAGSSEARIPLLRFRVEGDAFAVEAAHVREIVGRVSLTALPGAPAHIRGIMVLRRQVVGVLDLGRFLKLDRLDATVAIGPSAARIVILETALFTVGIYVDQVEGLDSWPQSAVQAHDVPESISKRTRSFARAARFEDESLTILLNIEKLLDDAAVR